MSSLKAAWERLCPAPPPGWKEPRARAAASQAQPGSSAEGQGAGGCRHGSTVATSPAAATGCELALHRGLMLCRARQPAMTPENVSSHVPCLGRYEKNHPRTSVSHLAFSYSKESFNTELCRRFIF